jgi:hypothetical protein
MKGNLKKRPIIVPEDRAPIDELDFDLVSQKDLFNECLRVDRAIFNLEKDFREKLKMLTIIGSVVAGALLVITMRKDD